MGGRVEAPAVEPTLACERGEKARTPHHEGPLPGTQTAVGILVIERQQRVDLRGPHVTGWQLVAFRPGRAIQRGPTDRQQSATTLLCRREGKFNGRGASQCEIIPRNKRRISVRSRLVIKSDQMNCHDKQRAICISKSDKQSRSSRPKRLDMQDDRTTTDR